MLFQGMRRATALAGCALMGGCSLFDPYVPVDNVHIADAPAAKASAMAQQGAAVNWERSQDLLKHEHDSAQRQADTYRDAAKTQARFKSGLAAGLIPLNAAALFEGGIHDRSDFVPIVGYGSAAALGLGGLLSSPARQAIYLQAQTATLCAMAAYDVYFIGADDYANHLTAGPEAMRRDILDVTRRRDELKAALTVYDGGTDVAVKEADAQEQKEKAAAAAKVKRPTAKKRTRAKPAVVGAAKPVAPSAGSAGRNSAATEPAVPNGQATARTGRLAAAAPAKPPPTPPAPPPPAPAPPTPAPAPPKPAKPAKPVKHAAAARAAPKPPSRGDRTRAAANSIDALAKDLITRAGTELTAAGATPTSLEGVRERVDEAGRSLGDHRMAIKAQVDQSVQTTELTVDQIKAAISASALATTQPGAAPPAAAGDKTAGKATAQAAQDATVRSELESERGQPVAAAMSRLETALATLEEHKSIADAWLLRELQKEHDATQAGTCTASAQVVLTATADNPAQVAVGKSLKIQIHAPTTGGAPTFTKVEDGLTATMTTGGGYDYTLTIAEASSPTPASKDQSVTVSSGSQSVKVAFAVTDAADTKKDKPPGDPGTDGGKPGGDKPSGGKPDVAAPPPPGGGVSPSQKPPPVTPGAAHG